MPTNFDHVLNDEWSPLASWWSEERRSDPAYANDVEPLLRELVGNPVGRLLDVGCGEGWALSSFPDATMIGVDGSIDLLAMAPPGTHLVNARLPGLSWLQSGTLDGAFAVLVLEHLSTLDELFSELHRTIKSGGWFAVVLNHPAYTAPGAGPIVDPIDGEVLWRWGPYFTAATSEEIVAEHIVTFHHRPTGELLEAASRSGWKVERFIERPLSFETVTANETLRGQQGMPRLLGVRWLKY